MISVCGKASVLWLTDYGKKGKNPVPKMHHKKTHNRHKYVVYYDITDTCRICQMSVCCGYLQALVILDQPLGNNVERSDLASKISTFTVRRSLDWHCWLFRNKLKRMLCLQFRILESGSSLGHRLLHGPWSLVCQAPAHVPHLSPSPLAVEPAWLQTFLKPFCLFLCLYSMMSNGAPVSAGLSRPYK